MKNIVKFIAFVVVIMLPIAAHAASPLANDRTFISELNAAYGTHFMADNRK